MSFPLQLVRQPKRVDAPNRYGLPAFYSTRLDILEAGAGCGFTLVTTVIDPTTAE